MHFAGLFRCQSPGKREDLDTKSAFESASPEWAGSNPNPILIRLPISRPRPNVPPALMRPGCRAVPIADSRASRQAACMAGSLSRALVIVNRRSRRGDDDVRAALDVLRKGGFRLVQAYNVQPSAVLELLLQNRDKVDCVILGGGDGTLNAAAGALMQTELPFGILPLGTGNDLARTLGIPPDPRRAAQVIVERKVYAIDVGLANDQCFFNVANMGLGVRITGSLSPELKRRWGALGYVRAVAHAVRHARPFTADIRGGGKTRKLRTIQLAVANGKHYGGGNTVSEDAAIDDRLLILYSVKPVSWFRLLRLAPAVRFGLSPNGDIVTMMSGREFEVSTSRPMRINTDGESTTVTPARFHLHPKTVSVFVPKTFLNPEE